MRTHWKSWLVFALLVGTTAYCVAEQITLTTTYPSPKGVYQELRTTSNTYLATLGGNVGIGTMTSPQAFAAARALSLDAGGAGEGLIEIIRQGAALGARIGQYDWVAPGQGGQMAALAADVTGGTSGNAGADMLFWTKRDGGPLVEGMRLTRDGNLGIGTPTPLVPLHVNGRTFIDASGANHALPVGAGNTYALVIDQAAGEKVLTIRDPGANNLVEIDANGNTGWGWFGWGGAANPLGKLHVNGALAGTITADVAPGAGANPGWSGLPYTATIYARNPVSAGTPGAYNNVAIAGIQTNGGGAGVYGEGKTAIAGRALVNGPGPSYAGFFSGPVTIVDESVGIPALPVGGLLYVARSIGVNMGEQAYRQLDVAGTIVARPRLTLVQTWVGATIAEQNAATPTWNLDNDGGIFRIFTEPQLVPPAPGQVWLTIDAGAGGRVDIPGLLAIGSPAFSPYRLDVNGDARISGTLTMGGAIIGDIAEQMDCADCEAGDVVVVDPENDRHVTRSTKAYDSTFAGVISEKPSLNIGGSRSETAKPLALAGQVKCKVTTENGPIKRGDLLVTSSKPGHAMRADSESIKPGTLIGKALEPLAEGDGEIVVLIIGG